MTKNNILLFSEVIANKIFFIRRKKVMLDRDLAGLYQVTTGNLNKAVKRNIERFPKDFMFQLNKDEFKNLIFHFGRSRWGGTRRLPFVFTEQGVAMLSSILSSKRAILVNIQIIRTFIILRKMLASNRDIKLRIESMERKYNKQFKTVFEVIKRLITEEKKPKKIMGFHYRK